MGFVKKKARARSFSVVFLGFVLSACTHTIDFSTSHFAVPHVSEKQFGGNAYASSAQVSKITVVSSLDGNPPTNSIAINEDEDVTSLLLLDDIAAGFDMALIGPMELFYEDGRAGLRIQFLGHGSGAGSFVGSIQGAYDTFDEASSSDSYQVDSNVETTQYGMSLGKKTDNIIVYVSYIHEKHKIDTTVVNGSGSFGPYNDEGIHKTYSFGLSSHRPGLLAGIEYNYVDMAWNDSTTDTQESLGLRLGFEW